MVLSKYDIKRCIEFEKLVEDYSEQNIQTGSYDLRFSGEYYCCRESVNNQINIENSAEMHLPAEAVCYIISKETINMPNYLVGEISLSFNLVKRGVMLSPQPPIDAGYHGKIVGMLHNLSDDTIVIREGDHVLNIVFFQLVTSLRKEDLYSGKYQDLTSLNQYCTKGMVGAVYKLREEVRRKKEKLLECIPNMLIIVTIVIGVLAVVCALLSLIERGN